jgi:23S rRNA pseudouridine1911/1915/1917 synthase
VVLTVPDGEAGERLDRWLQQRLAEYSRARIQEWIRGGRVRVNGAASRPAHRLRGGERIEVEPAPPPPLRAAPEPIPIRVLYEDDDVIAVDKPAGMVVHAGAGRQTGTLVNALLHRYGRLSEAGGPLRPGIVHRLDRQTSGVILVARNDRAHRSLAAQFAARRIEKVYLALVHGEIAQEQGRVEAPIARDPARRVRMSARLGHGRAALTEFRVLRRFPGFTFLEVHLKTGRTHQIRTHLAWLGRPIVGDRLYGAPRRIEGRPPLDRYFLHAHRIRFLHPATGRPVAIESPLPAELARWLEGLGSGQQSSQAPSVERSVRG